MGTKASEAKSTAQKKRIPADYINRRTQIATFLVALYVTYTIAIIDSWRSMSIRTFLWICARNPAGLLTSFSFRYLSLILAMNCLFLLSIREYTEKMIPSSVLYAVLFAVVAACQLVKGKFVALGAALGKHYTMRLVVEIVGALALTTALHRIIVSVKSYYPLHFPLDGLPWKLDKKEGSRKRSAGLLGYISYMSTVRSLWYVLAGVVQLVWFVTRFLDCSFFDALAVALHVFISALGTFGAFFVLFHTYAFNLKFFSINPVALAPENGFDTPRSAILVYNYVDREEEPIPEDLEVVYRYAIDALGHISTDIYSLVKYQRKVARVEPSKTPGRIRDLPDILLSTGSCNKKLPSLKTRLFSSDFSTKFAHRVLYTVFAGFVYSSICDKALLLRPSIKKLKNLSWRTAISKKQRLIELITDAKQELGKLQTRDVSDLMCLLSSWIVYLEK